MLETKPVTSTMHKTRGFNIDIRNIDHGEANGSGYAGKGITMKMGPILMQFFVARRTNGKK